jgi:hypothetical protein
MLIFDLVTKYCQYSETLGAIINGFELSNKNKHHSSAIVLKYLKDYQVQQVTDFFQDISSPDYKSLSDKHKEKLVIAFKLQKLDKNKIDETVNSIFNRLKEIAGVYIFYLDSYNAYKHGHRVWYGYDLGTQKSNFLYYITKEYMPNSYKMDHVPLDDTMYFRSS